MFTHTLNVIAKPVAEAATLQDEGRTSAAPAALKEDRAGIGKPQILEEVVIEEVSIDGMCGVY